MTGQWSLCGNTLVRFLGDDPEGNYIFEGSFDGTQFSGYYDESIVTDYGCFTLTPIIYGCTDPVACNYDSTANTNDGSCEYISCLDECGVPNGDNSTCLDECGVPNGDNSTCLDECGVINGDNSTCLDECGVINGDNTTCLDECGVINGDNTTCLDECGVINGNGPNQYEDCDGNCLNDEDNDNICDEIDDCVGILSGETTIMNCGDFENSYSCNSMPECWWDNCWYLGESCGGCMGGNFEIDNTICEEIEEGCTDFNACNYNYSANTEDGSCEYTSCLDDCGVINGDNSSCSDCCGVPYGDGTSCDGVCGSCNDDNSCLDECGVPNGDNSTCLDNCGVPNGDNSSCLDDCGVINGDNSTCSGCTDNTATNYDENAIVDDGSCNYMFSQNIPLPEGWSMISTYIDPLNNDLDEIFDGVVDDLVLIKDQSGFVYWPQFALNNIYSLSIGEGYQINMSSQNNLLIQGSLINPSTEISLNSGWNIMGYLHTEPSDLVSMMSTMNTSNLIIMKDSWGNVYWPQFGLNNIENMSPGRGYQIKLAGSWEFSYPELISARYGDVYLERPVHFDEPANTGNNMIIGLPLNAWETTPFIGDEIAAYGEDGTLIGSTTFQGDHIALTIWGDDLTTNKKEGISEGETISFKLWNSQTGVEQALEVRWSQGVGFYTTDGISVAGQIILGSELTTEKQLVKITDVLGREVNGDEKDVMLLYIYDDGSIERVYTKE